MLSTRGVATAFTLILLLASGFAVTAKDKTMTGRELYKEYCKDCHTADSPNGEYTPLSLIQDQWKEFFDDNLVPTHKGVTDPKHGDKPVLELLTPEELKTLRDWTIDHAADSENPMTCG